MLSESFVACCGLPSSPGQKTSNPTPSVKDASIVIHGLMPQANVQQIFKKSAAAPNCIAVSEEHIFAAQADKAIVNVYSRQRGNQECLIPFQERITAIALACDETLLIMGTESGRLMLWETCTGRFKLTSSAHLQAITCIAVSPDSNFAISGSADSSVHSWSLPLLLSFDGGSDGSSPIASMTHHRAGITALAISGMAGQGAIAVSCTPDGTAIAFDYVKGELLRTFLLTDAPSSLIMDPADRGFFAGYQDGSVQLIDFFDRGVNATADSVHFLRTDDAKLTPAQPQAASRWPAYAPLDSAPSAVLSMSLSWDGMTLLSGHANGQILKWDVGQCSWHSIMLTLGGPVTNLQFLPLEGWPCRPKQDRRNFKVDKVVKPRFEADNQQHGDGTVPGNYSWTAQLSSSLDGRGHNEPDLQLDWTRSDFYQAFSCSTGFPSDMLEQSIAELATWKHSDGPAYTNVPGTGAHPTDETGSANFMALDEGESETSEEQKRSNGVKVPQLSLSEQNDLLRKKLAALQRVQRLTFKQLDDLRAEHNERSSGSNETEK